MDGRTLDHGPGNSHCLCQAMQTLVLIKCPYLLKTQSKQVTLVNIDLWSQFGFSWRKDYHFSIDITILGS